MRDADRHLTDHELLARLDGELDPRGRAAAARHLGGCVVCQARAAQIERTATDLSDLYRNDLAAAAAAQGEGLEHARNRLRATLHEQRDDAPRFGLARVVATLALPARHWGTIAATVAAVAAIALFVRAEPRRAARSVERDALPIASLTPGATWDVSPQELCNGIEREQRPIPVDLRQQVLHDYQMETVSPDDYELDYLITPELGGAPVARNLWPQRYTSRVWNARVKDQLERLLPRLVCDQRVALDTAQRDIAADWIAAYKKYFKTESPLSTPAQASFLGDDEFATDRRRGDLTYPVWRSPEAPALTLIAFHPAR
jgi:anti-sigma factor RsiW